MTTAPVKAVKLTACTGAYWRGSEKQDALSRIYGTAFPKKAELDAYLAQLEEAKNGITAVWARSSACSPSWTKAPASPSFFPKGCCSKTG